MSRRAFATALAASLLALVLSACGSVHRVGGPSPPNDAGVAVVEGHVSWPDCPRSAPSCPPLDEVPIHFADAAANRTFTAVSDGSGGYSIQLPPGSYVVIAGNADRSPYQQQITVRRDEVITLDLSIALPTGRAAALEDQAAQTLAGAGDISS
jgi:hypothetical protein